MSRALRAVCFGECMLELQGEAFGVMRQTYGGDTLNTAVYMARSGLAQGLWVDYATALGDDGLSHGMMTRWDAEGVGTGLVRRLPGRMPGLYLIEVNAAGERSFSYWRDQAAARDYFDTALADTPLERAEDSIDALYFSGISMAIVGAAGRRRLLALARRLRDRSAQVIFDNNYRPRLWPMQDAARSAFEQACEVATVALMTLDDEQALWGQPDEQRQLSATLALPTPEVVVKRGALPTLVRTSDGVHEVATEPVAKVVDTTAAGDSFAGAYVAARLRGEPPESAARAGNRLAARVVQHPGAVIPLEAMSDLLGAR